MRFKKTLFLFAITLAFASVATGQDKSLGAIKGKVRVETGTPAGVTVVVRRGDTEVTRSSTDKNGDFLVSKLTPGKYGVTFRKPGLSIGSLEDIEVKAGKKGRGWSPDATRWLPFDELDRLLDALRADGRTLIGPVVRDEAIILDEIASAADLPASGSHHFSIPFEALGRKWVRFAAWDVAGNGALVQPVKLAR